MRSKNGFVLMANVEVIVYRMESKFCPYSIDIVDVIPASGWEGYPLNEELTLIETDQIPLSIYKHRQ